MEVFTWGLDPWGQTIPIRISWDLLWLFGFAGLLFVVAHALYVRFRPKATGPNDPGVLQRLAAGLPEQVARHSLAARLFHWTMAATMFGLLLTSFLPIVGIEFAWVTLHWIVGLVLTLSIIYHIIHASFWLDFRSIWLEQADLQNAWRSVQSSFGQTVPAPGKAAKYPPENKMYHTLIVLTCLAAVITGLLMMVRVRTPLLPRNPYLFTDWTWGLVYVLHGLASTSLVALVLAHVYFAVRPEARSIAKGMILGWIDRKHYVEYHDPQRWPL